jgi:2-polyprenyl-3-methyl-5-hydroxy-6-metoxy-1,4-benzoquinol methylase
MSISFELLNECPACGNPQSNKTLEVEDFTVSRESFSLVKCSSCQLLFTNPRPVEAEIGTYYRSEEYISHTNSRKGLLNGVYQWARGRAIASKIGLIESLNSSPRSLLDYGCGTGEFLAAAKKKGWICAGLEPDDGARKQAKSNHGLNVELPDKLWDLPEGQFGVITLWHVLEHVHRLNETVHQLIRCLSSQGRLLIAVPNCLSHESRHYGSYWAAYDVPRHLYHFSRTPMLKLMEKYGLELEKVKPLFFDPFYISLLSEKYKTGKSNPMAAAWQGLQTTFAGRKNLDENSSLLYVFKRR